MISDIKFSKKAVEMGWLTTEQLQHCLKKQRQLWKQGKNLTLQECIKTENILNEDQILIIEQNCRQTNISDSPVQKTAIAPRMKRRQKTNHLSQQKKSKKLAIKKRVKQLDLPKKSQPQQEEKLPESMPSNFMEKLDSETPTAQLPQNMGNEFLQKFTTKQSSEPQEKPSNVPQAMGNTFMQKFAAKQTAAQEQNDADLPPTMNNDFLQKFATNTPQGTAPDTQEKSSTVPQAMGNTFMQKFSTKQTPEQQAKDSNLPPTMNNDLANKVSEKIQAPQENDSLLATVNMPPPQNNEQRASYKKKLEIGEMFGHYKVEKLLGQGGMGIVYRALDTKLNRTVALKILSVHNVGKQVLTRFKQEALATAQLDHPNIVRLFEVDSNPQDYFTMEYVEGHTLDFHIKKRNLDLAQSAAIIKKIANALQEAHKKNIIHRDVKPGNILLDKNNQPKIMDFGLAKFTSAKQNLTKKGSILGTPNYMAPEQFKGDKVDKRADIYALGATLYEMITFSRLFDGQTPMSIAAEIFTTRPTPPRAIRPSIPENLEQICLKALEKSPKKRYLNAAFMAKDLDSFLHGRPTSFENTSHLYKAKSFIAANKYMITVLVLLIAFTVTHWKQKLYYTQQIQNYKPLANKSIEALYAALQDNEQSIAAHSFAIIQKFTELQTPLTAKTKNQFEYLCEYTFVSNHGYEEQGLEILRQFTRKESNLCNPSSALYIIEGIICEKLGQSTAASFAYQQAAKLDPKNNRAHLLHGNYYAKKAFLKLQSSPKPNARINADVKKIYKKAIISWQKLNSKKQMIQQIKRIVKNLQEAKGPKHESILEMASIIHQSILHQWKEQSMPEFTVSCACGKTKVAVNLQSPQYVLQLVCLHCKELILNRQSQPHVAESIEAENKFRPKEKQTVAKDNYFGKYIVVKKLGEGGMAAVYKAIDSESQQPTALKIFKKLDDEKSLQYIMREAKILAKLQHPNIVAFKKAGTHKQFPYIAMEYVDGKSLEELIQLYGPFEPKDAVQIMLYVVEAMIYASQFQLVHRDIKPANILISQSGVIKLIDLGVGKILEDSGVLTRTGEVVGTCFYMPYEQFQDSKNIDFRVDVYAIGATLYHLLCGVPPYWEYGENVNKLIFAKIGNRYIPLSEKKTGIPQIVLNLVEKAMNHDPKERYQTLFEMKKEWLTAYQQL